MPELEASLEQEVEQLRTALESRVVIEQAKGVLAERYRLSIDDAFLLLRKSARSARVRIHDLAAEVVRSPSTPVAVIRGIARDSRLRAVAQRERSEGIVERTRRLEAEHIDQRERLGQWIGKTAARIRAESRSDAVDLAARLSGYRWYLVALDEQRWNVVVEFNGDPTKLPQALRDHITEWMNTRSLTSVQIRLGNSDLSLYA